MMKVQRKKIVAAAVLSLMVLSTFFGAVAFSDDSEADSDSWACRITVSGTSLVTTYSKAGGAFADMTQVVGTSKTVGSWGYDSDGYGPFGSFYAAFDPAQNNAMVCHLNPSDLTKSTDGTDISGNNYNIMWCLPKIYLSVSGSTITLASDTSYGGTLAPAFTVGGSDYNYMALGVYEATYVNSKLGSVSGQTPQASTSLAAYRTEAKANTMIDGSVALLWNFHQYQLYRLCSLAVMENFDSQAQIGMGNASGSSSSKTGTMDASGPYYGTSSYNANGAKLFIENAWGSLWEYVDDAWWSSGLYAGQNLNPTSDTSNKTKTTVTSGLSGYGTSPYSTKIDSWGLPTATASSNSSTAPDYFYSSSSGNALVVGGIWSYTSSAGLSCLNNSDDGGYSNIGTRLAFLFAADTAATPTVTYDHSNLTAALGDGGTAAAKLTQKKVIEGNTSYDQLPQQGDWRHIGWEIDGEVYTTTHAFVSDKSHTAKSVWTKYPVATLDHEALANLGGSTKGLATELVITDSTVTYPDLGTVDGFTHIGWYVDDTFYSTTHTVVKTSDHKAYSVWRAPSITITFMVEGEEHSTLEVPKGSVGIVYTPKQVTGVFMGWFYDSSYTEKYDATKSLTVDTILYAKGVKPLEFTSVPTANATITNVDSSGLVFFDATDSTGRMSVLWDFGDGNTSTDPIAYNSYAEPGTYTATLTVTNASGQTDTRTYTVVYAGEDSGSDGKDPALLYVIAGVIVILAAVFVARRFI